MGYTSVPIIATQQMALAVGYAVLPAPAVAMQAVEALLFCTSDFLLRGHGASSTGVTKLANQYHLVPISNLDRLSPDNTQPAVASVAGTPTLMIEYHGVPRSER